MVAVNKMDDKSVRWQQKRFDEIVQNESESLRKLGFAVASTLFVPISDL